MKCEFEEKQYEQLLNMELAGTKQILYVPGQVFENVIGIDAAIYSRSRRFWRLWRFRPSWPPGVYLEPRFWDWTGKELDDDAFPKFRFNVFVQHKRPEYISSRLGREYRYWNRPYFRYDLNASQQHVLHKLEQKVSSSAIVVYACAAFWQLKELWDLNRNRTLVENSSFVQPYNLSGHQRYTFIRDGNIGKAFSEPLDIESIDLVKEIDRMFEVGEHFENNTGFIYSLYRSIMEVVRDLDEDHRIGFVSLLEHIGIPPHELAGSLISILIFAFLTGTIWGIAYE